MRRQASRDSAGSHARTALMQGAGDGRPHRVELGGCELEPCEGERGRGDDGELSREHGGQYAVIAVSVRDQAEGAARAVEAMAMRDNCASARSHSIPVFRKTQGTKWKQI